MTTYCGFIAIVGRPNVGKSTLLNQILQQKISITSRKAQTTRNRILGIHTDGDYQYVYVDTPGIHPNAKKSMNRIMNKTATSSLSDVDAVVFVIEGTNWQDEDEYVLHLIMKSRVPCFLVVNKIDKLVDKSVLLPWLNELSQRHTFAAIIPISAKTGLQVDVLEVQLKIVLPEGPHCFDANQVTDRSTRFLCAELLREKIFRGCGQELPYSATVEIESYKETPALIRIHALIVVEKESHKRMIIGNQGQKLKELATQARLDMEQMLNRKVFLQCWCKVKPGWTSDDRSLQHLES